MPTLLAISGFLTVIFAYLYLYSSYRMRRIVHQQHLNTIRLKEEIEILHQQAQQASRDQLTNLVSWKLFQERVEHGLKECDRYKFILGMLYVDIDEFNLINHALGNAAGNDLLRAVAERLQSCLRQVDGLCRQNKDTFVILLGQLAKQETAIIIIQRIMQSMSMPFAIGQHDLTVTVCIGAAFYPHDGANAANLFQNAEYAMLQAKEMGKNNYQFYQEKLYTDSQRELTLYNSLSSDLFLEDLELLYQPVMDMQTKTMLCAEAQVAWKHRLLGTIAKSELFDYADKHHKLNKITERVLRESCKKFINWQTLGLKPQMLSLAISLKQLENAQFVYNISQILLEVKMQPQWLMLEIQEAATPLSLDILEKSFNMLQYMGVKIALDGFGSNPFPLRYLKAFTVSYLKLDAALIADVVLNEKTRAVIRGIAAFASELSLQVIATGVESESQVAVLRELGIVLMQGQLMSRPLSEAEMTDKMIDV